MKNKKILLISLIITIAMFNIGAVIATDTQEINNEKISADENLNKIDQYSAINDFAHEKNEDNSNTNKNNKMHTTINNDSKTNYELNSENIDETNLKASKLNNQILNSTIVIDGSASNQMNNPTIQNAIDNANPGDTLIISGKNYVHCHFVVDKKLNIISNVGTIMTPCPSNTYGSDAHGLFYISPEASGTIIQGFTLKNDIDDIDSYGIFVKGASDVNIMDCNVETKYADGIRIKNTNNIIIENSIIKNSHTGISILDSYKTSIKNNIITNNDGTGIYIGNGSSYININANNITNNKYAGITVYSGNHIYINNNFIAYNRDGDDYNYNIGAGIYINSILTKIEIKGNYIRQNGLYGVLNGPRTTNMDANNGAENLEIVDNNYFIKHGEKVAYHIIDGDTTNEAYVYEGTGSVVYLKHAYLIEETICGSTLYRAPDYVWGKYNLKLKLSEISQDKKGTYSVSIVDANGNIASDISSIYVTFYLNKNNTKAEPQKGDTYKTVLMKNGTATVTFNKKDYQSKGNVITACFPGLYDEYKSNPYATFNIADTEIPEDIINTKITVSDMKTTPNSGEYCTAKLTDMNGNPLANKVLSFTLNSKTYNISTDINGIAKLQIKLSTERTYELIVSFAGDEPYTTSTAKANIIIKKLSQKITSKNVVFAPKTNNYYQIILKDQFNQVIKNKNVKFTINGKTYTVKTNNNGIAKIKIKLSKKKTYKIKIYSSATSEYYAVTKTSKITIKKLKQKIISSNNKFAPKSTNYYSITLKDQNNKLIKNKKLTIKIGKKTYKKTTNQKGIVKLKIKYSKAKTYKVKITSPTTSKYKAVKKTDKITITKLKQKITSSNKKYLTQAGEDYIIALKDENNKVIKKKVVKFTINGKTYNVKTNNNGVAKLKISLTKENIYNLKINSPATKQYKAITKTNKITIEKGTPELITSDRTFANNINNEYIVYLKDYRGNALSNGKINFNINSNVYSATTDSEGMAKLSINLNEAKQYQLIINFLGDIKNKAISKTNTITIKNANNTRFVDNDLSNDEIQKLIFESPENSNIEFLGSNYEGISLNINKALNIYSNTGTKLNGISGQPVVKINANNVKLSNFNIIVNSVNSESDGILVNNVNNVNIMNTTISNSLDSSKMSAYNDGSTILPGIGIKILNSKNIAVINNKINSFESGIYNEYSQNLTICENQIKSNNYGIKYGFGSSNTTIFNNTITDNIGWYVMDVPEGPRGYGIFLNNSAVNINIKQNNICNNYMGISIDANKSTGIIVTSNLISDNALEGIRFNAGYDLADNVVEPVIEDNAIYRNAKGPSMMILGEMSANPEGIYGPGQWDDNLKLKIGYNWYGTNLLKTWNNDTGITGIGTMCPRINASSIGFNKIESNIPGTYNIKFYKNSTELATNLATFDLYATLNRGTNKQTEVKFDVVNGTATFSFDKKYYLDSDNKIEISVGSLINMDRIYTVIFDYNIPDAEISL